MTFVANEDHPEATAISDEYARMREALELLALVADPTIKAVALEGLGRPNGEPGGRTAA